MDQSLFSTDDEILSLFSQYDPVDNFDTRKQTITVKNFLTMRHGLDWDELTLPYGDPNNSLSIAVENCTDYVECLLDLPMIADPDTTFSYSTHVSLALGVLVEQESETDYQSYANQNLLEPLQITNYLWNELTPAG